MCGQKIAEYKQNEREYQKRIDDWSEKTTYKQWLLQEVSENDIYTRIIGKKSACD